MWTSGLDVALKGIQWSGRRWCSGADRLTIADVMGAAMTPPFVGTRATVPKQSSRT
jgi:hypothetical protein